MKRKKEGIESLFNLVEKKRNRNEIEGFLFGLEWLCLYYLARKCEGKGHIVEIGSYKGKSTSELARGLRDNHLMKNKKVYSVDHHQGSEEHKKKGKKINTFQIFKKNMERLGLINYVSPMVMSSKEASKQFKDKVELLFIDGSHDYKDVKSDFENWYPKLVKGGVMAFHDSNWEGPADVIEFYIKESGNFDSISRVNSITYARKVK